MKSPRQAQTATSLPRSPQDDESARIRRYAVTMGIRVVCFVLAAAVQPYGWWTWAFAAGAILLPYFAVVLANVGAQDPSRDVVSPERMLDAPAPAAPVQPETTSNVIRIQETRRPEADA